MSVLCPPVYVEPPAATPSRFGLYSSAQVTDDASDHDFCGLQAQPWACLTAKSTSPICPPTEPVPKVSDDGNPVITGDPWTAYAGFRCRTVGMTPKEMQDRATAALALGEQREVERVFWTGGVTGGTPGLITPHLARPDCTVLNTTPGAAGAFDIPTGVGALEDYAAGLYSGTPILHAPRGLAALAAGNMIVIRDGSRLITPVGTFWAFGAGYSAANTGPDGTTAPAGTAWIYVTGAIQIRRSPVFYTPPSPEAGLNRASNEITLLAERSFVTLQDCLCGAALVKLSCGCC